MRTAVPQIGLCTTQFSKTGFGTIRRVSVDWRVGRQAFDGLRQLGRAHSYMEPVENGFSKFAEFTLRLSYRFAAIRKKRRWLRGKYALFSQESLHPLTRLRFKPMNEGEHLAATCPR